MTRAHTIPATACPTIPPPATSRGISGSWLRLLVGLAFAGGATLSAQTMIPYLEITIKAPSNSLAWDGFAAHASDDGEPFGGFSGSNEITIFTAVFAAGTFQVFDGRWLPINTSLYPPGNFLMSASTDATFTAVAFLADLGDTGTLGASGIFVKANNRERVSAAVEAGADGPIWTFRYGTSELTLPVGSDLNLVYGGWLRRPSEDEWVVMSASGVLVEGRLAYFSPIPEPSTHAVIAGAAVLLGAVVLRRRASRQA